MASDKIVRFSVNFLKLDASINLLLSELENWYSMECSCTLITMDGGIKLMALLDCGAEVNVMTHKVIVVANFAM